jgi:DnaK suppressor protein
VTAVKKAAPPSAKKAAPAVKKATTSSASKVNSHKATAKKSPATTGAGTKKPAAKKAPAAAKKASAPAKKATTAGTKTAPVAKKASTATTAPATKATTAGTKTAPVAKKASAATKPPPKKPSVGPYAKEPKFLEEQRALLLEERSVYAGQAVDLRAEADSLALEREPGDVQFDEESGEGGTVTVDRERNLALSAQASAAVEEIDDAFRKIDRKTYGGCERCHQAIPKARLRALPFARLCVACKSGGLSRR